MVEHFDLLNKVRTGLFIIDTPRQYHEVQILALLEQNVPLAQPKVEFWFPAEVEVGQRVL